LISQAAPKPKHKKHKHRVTRDDLPPGLQEQFGTTMPQQAYCCVCGKPGTTFHHVPSKSLAGGDHDSGVRLCGSGTTGCHGRAEGKQITFSFDRVWMFVVHDREYAKKLTRKNYHSGMRWDWPLGHIEPGVAYRCITE